MAVFLLSSIEATLIDEQQLFPDRTNDPGRWAACLQLSGGFVYHMQYLPDFLAKVIQFIVFTNHIYLIYNKKCGWPEGSLFNSYNTEV